MSSERLSKRGIALLLFFVYFTFIGGTVYGSFFFWPRLISQTALLLIVGGWLLSLILRNQTLPRTPLDAPILGIMVVSLAATATSTNRRLSSEVLPQVFIYVLMYYLVVDLLGRGWEPNLFLKSILMTGSVVLIFGLFECVSWYFGVPVFPGFSQGWWDIGGVSAPIPPKMLRLYFTLNNPNHLALYLVLVIPLALKVVFFTPSRWRRTNAIVWLILAAFTMFLTFSRGGWLGLAVAITVFSFLIRHTLRKELSLSLKVLLLVLGSGILAFAASYVLSSFGSRIETVLLRLKLWGFALNVIAERPFLGVGPGTFGQACLRLQAPSFGIAGLQRGAFSTYLTIVAELGLAGLFVMVWLALALVAASRRAWEKKAPEEEGLIAACIASLSGAFTHNFFDSFPGSSVQILHIVIFSAILISKTKLRRGSLLGKPIFAAIAIVAIAFALGWFAYARYYFELGVDAANEGDWSRASVNFERATQIDAGFALNYFQLGLAYGHLAYEDEVYLQEAIECLLRGLEIEPDYTPAHANLAALYWQSGERETALVEMKEALKREQGNTIYRLNLGLFYEEVGLKDKAIEEYASVLSADPSIATSGFWRGKEQIWPIVLEKAKERGGHLMRGKLAYFSGDLNEAIEEFRLAISLDPLSAEGHAWLGKVLADLGRDDEALIHLNRALEIDQSYAEAYLNRGCVSFQRGELLLAEWDLKTALFLEPGEVLAHYYLGRIAYRRGEIEKAIEEWRLAFPSRYSFTIYEAIVYGRRGMDYNLLPQLRRICPTGLLVLPYLELARLYEEKGLMAKAKELYQQLSHYDPDFGVYISHQRRE